MLEFKPSFVSFIDSNFIGKYIALFERERLNCFPIKIVIVFVMQRKYEVSNKIATRFVIKIEAFLRRGLLNIYIVILLLSTLF